MPCLNESQTVAACVEKAYLWLDQAELDGEVIVVDNGSRDGSADLAIAAGARVVTEVARGYGYALRRGFAEARGDWLVMGDSDGTYDFSDLDALIEALADGADLSIGNRYAGGIAPGAMRWSHRYIGTPAISLLLRLLTGLELRDSQCGLRAITREALDRLDLQTNGMELASEMILKAGRRELKVAEVPAPYAERQGEAKLNTFRDGWRHLRFLILASPNYLFTLPGAFMMALGILILSATAITPGDRIEIGDVRWQPIFAGTIFVVVGFNALMLGVASRLYTSARGITNEDFLTRFYRRFLSFEVFVLAGLAMVAAGILLDLTSLMAGPGAGSISTAAIAQALIIVGANCGLVGALASLLDERQR
jgi:glycosyltransferase involved in cell wall biosynthesis